MSHFPYGHSPKFLYFVLDETSGFIKVGSTQKNPLIRLSDLRVGTPHDLRLIGVCRATKLHEREFHREFRAHKHRGEWYRPFPELMSFISKLPSGADYVDGAALPALAPVSDSMVAMRDYGYTYDQIGEFYGISRQAIFQNVNGRTKRTLPRGGRNKEPRVETPSIEEFYMAHCSDHSVLTLES